MIWRAAFWSGSRPMLDGGVDYIRETETQSSTKEKTITPESESMMAMVRKTVEYYTVKRRRDNAL